MTKILAIETSCDETAAAIIEDGYKIHSNVVASQIDIHRRYGGVFPEVASRQHILAIGTVIQDSLIEGRTAWDQLDAVAVTYGPGLVGSLLVGVNAAKGLALAQGLPLIGVNHLEGHLYSTWLDHEGRGQAPEIRFPSLCLVVSGGHTELVLIRAHGNYEILGRTIDDAAGEAFDKVARLLDLGFPGGPAIQKAAQAGNPRAYGFPQARLGDSFDFSFSGLKTAVLREVQKFKKVDRLHRSPQGQQLPLSTVPTADIAASFQMAVVEVLVAKTKVAARQYDATEVLLVGGVAANTLLRSEMARQIDRPLRIPPVWLCTDNASMIGAAAYWHYQVGQTSEMDLDVKANLRLDTH